MNDKPKLYRIRYSVHCRFQNFFSKEIIIKNCLSEVHAKMKLGTFCENKYGVEFGFVKFTSVKCEDNISDLFKDVFGTDVFSDILNIEKKK